MYFEKKGNGSRFENRTKPMTVGRPSNIVTHSPRSLEGGTKGNVFRVVLCSAGFYATDIRHSSRELFSSPGLFDRHFFV